MRLADHPIHVRASDLDTLNHVNNVRFLDYVDDARHALVGSGRLSAAPRVGSCDVEYHQPLAFTRAPVLVTTELEGGLLVQEVTSRPEGGQLVHARVTIELVEEFAELAPMGMPGIVTHHYLRSSDLVDGYAGNAQTFGLLQESRIQAFNRPHRTRPDERIVVAQSRVQYSGPIPMLRSGYELTVGLERFGRASLTTRLQLTDRGRVLADATAVMVAFNSDTQRSRPFSEDERAEFLAKFPTGASESAR